MSTPVAVPPGPADDRTVATIVRVAHEQHPSPWPDAAVLALTARIERDQVAIAAARGALISLARSMDGPGDHQLRAAGGRIMQILADLEDAVGGHR